MPFSCIAKLDPELFREDRLIFDAWIEGPWKQFVLGGTAFARVHDSRGSGELCLTGPGFLSSHREFEPDTVLQAGQVVAYFAANGEDIPYGQPYCYVRWSE